MVYDICPVRLSPWRAYCVRVWRTATTNGPTIATTFRHKRDAMLYQMRVVSWGGLVDSVSLVRRPPAWFDSLDAFDAAGVPTEPPLTVGSLSPVLHYPAQR